MATATYVFEVNWIGDGTTWVDETSNLLRASWRRGRDYASQLTGRASAGELTVELGNIAGRFAPLNTASPLHGNLLPGRKLRIRSTAPTAATLWTGFLEEIRPSPGTRGDFPKAILRASGPLRYIADKKASTGVYTSTLTGAAVGYILDDAGWPVADRLLDTGQITMNRWKADGDTALSHLRELEEMEFGYIGETKTGKIVWEDANHRLSLTTSQATFSDSLSGSGSTTAAFQTNAFQNDAFDAEGVSALPPSLSYSDVEELDPWREVFNIFTADVVYFTLQAIAVLWQMSGEVPAINPSATKDFWTVYPTPDAPPEADSVDTWTTPVATTDYLANTQIDGLGTDKTANVSIAVSKFANSMKISITNNDAGVVYITFLRARGAAVYKSDPIRVVTEDSASQTTFGKRTYPLPGKFYPSTAVAKAYTEAGLARYKDQLAILELRYLANQSSDHMTQALTRDVGERITVVANSTEASGAQLGIIGDFFIEAEKHEYDLSAHWVSYALSDARTVTGYWLLGISQLDSETKLAP